jgi:hypothetical protein
MLLVAATVEYFKINGERLGGMARKREIYQVDGTRELPSFLLLLQL